MKPHLQLKQTEKVKLCVRTQLMYGATGIALAAIIAGIIVFLYSNLGTSKKAQATIQLVYFKAVLETKTSVHLTWETASEQSNNYFIIQRSIDGTSWENIDTVACTGNSFVIKDYTLYDNHPIKGVSYYRLRQCDVDLTFAYNSDVVMIVFEEENDNLSNDFSAYPNPTRGVFNVSMPEITDQTMIRVFDIKGVLIKEIKPTTGANTEIDFSGKSPGIYLVKVGTGGTGDVSKQIVLTR